MAGASGEYVLGKSVLGTSTSEVVLETLNTWYNQRGTVSDRDYIIRGGIDRGMFYFGNITMSEVQDSTRTSIVKK